MPLNIFLSFRLNCYSKKRKMFFETFKNRYQMLKIHSTCFSKNKILTNLSQKIKPKPNSKLSLKIFIKNNIKCM